MNERGEVYTIDQSSVLFVWFCRSLDYILEISCERGCWSSYVPYHSLRPRFHCCIDFENFVCYDMFFFSDFYEELANYRSANLH
jgi:hypothetical protein